MSNDRALRTYLNDHLAGSTLGVELAHELEGALEGTPHGAAMRRVAHEIEEDREALKRLMVQVDATPNPIKAATAWVAQKVSRLKFSGMTARNRALGTFLALEAMSLGVEGKRGLWIALDRVAPETPALRGVDFASLIARAESQRDALERARGEFADAALA